MSIKPDLKRRLLYLFPIKLLREYFRVTGASRGDVASEVMRKYDEASILTFADESFGFTRQHVFVFDHSFRLGNIPSQINGISAVPAPNNSEAKLFLFDLTYEYVAEDLDDDRSVAKGSIQFKWPVKVGTIAGKLVVYITIMEKDIQTYLPDNLAVIRAIRDLDENHVLNEIARAIGLASLPNRLNLNKGIKELWKLKDFIDSSSMAYRKTHSTTSQDMDQTYFVKKDDPQAFSEALAKPLLKTIFKKMEKESDIPEAFAIDAEAGQLSFARYSNDKSEVINVLQKILRHN